MSKAVNFSFTPFSAHLIDNLCNPIMHKPNTINFSLFVSLNEMIQLDNLRFLFVEAIKTMTLPTFW